MAVFLLRRAAFVIPEHLPVQAQASEWGHLRHEVPQVLRKTRSPVQQAQIAQLPRVAVYCHRKRMNRPDKYEAAKAEITAIYQGKA